jgi:hypothetical protein
MVIIDIIRLTDVKFAENGLNSQNSFKFVLNF